MTYDRALLHAWPSTPRSKGQEDKVAAGLVKLNEEDASFTYGNNPETKEMIIAGVGDIHLSVHHRQAAEQV